MRFSKAFQNVEKTSPGARIHHFLTFLKNRKFWTFFSEKCHVLTFHKFHFLHWNRKFWDFDQSKFLILHWGQNYFTLGTKKLIKFWMKKWKFEIFWNFSKCRKNKSGGQDTPFSYFFGKSKFWTFFTEKCHVLTFHEFHFLHWNRKFWVFD